MRPVSSALLLACTVAVVGALAIFMPAPASASPGQVLSLAQATPAVGPGFVDSFTVNCLSASAVRIASPLGHTMLSYECVNESTTMVAVGDSLITDPGTTRSGPVFCASGGTCPTAAASSFGGDVTAEFCRGDTDTTIYCRAMVSTLAAP